MYKILNKYTDFDFSQSFTWLEYGFVRQFYASNENEHCVKYHDFT